MSLTHSLRLVIGLACLAGGVSLAAPVVSRVLSAVRLELGSGLSCVGAPPSSPSRESPAAGCGERHPQKTLADSGVAEAEKEQGRPVPPAAKPAASARSRDGLPAWEAGWEFAPPRLGTTYRSAFDEPPPPLLDEAELRSKRITPGEISPVQARARRITAVAAARPQAESASSPTSGAAAEIVPAADSEGYLIRDGDDLAGIAARIYGDPNAAQAIWAANRDLVPDPDLLPIGTRLRLPRPWRQ